MNDIFSLSDRPDPDLFFTRNDRNDPRLGEIVGRAAEQYAAAEIVIVGCPQDEGERRNGGREGAASAPGEIPRQVYKLTLRPNGGLEITPRLPAALVGEN